MFYNISMFHSRSARKRYNRQNQLSSECDFCAPQERVARIVEENEFALVIENRTHYTYWERRRVQSHLLVIPKQHVMRLQELDAAARLAVMDLIAKYEDADYDVYLRSPKSPTRSVGHHHTHLIKSDKKLHNFVFFLGRPYLLIHR